MSGPETRTSPLILPRILKLIIYYIHVFVCHLKHIGIPNFEKVEKVGSMTKTF